MRLALAILLLGATPGAAETLVATRTLRPQTLVSAEDVVVVQGTVPGTASDPLEVIGLETRVAIYQGHPIRAADLGPPAIVERNQTVVLSYVAGPLTIVADGRALGRGGVGDSIRVMNTASRTTVSGVVAADGSVRVMGDR